MITKFDNPQPQTSQEVVINQSDLAKCSHQWHLYQRKKSDSCVFYQDCCSLCGDSGKIYKKKDLSNEQISKALYCTYEDLQKLRTAHYERQSAEYTRVTQILNQGWWEWYNEYLQSSIWKEKARKVMQRAKGLCEACLENQATQVHHLSYNHVGREPLFELVAVCNECHQDIHKKAK